MGMGSHVGALDILRSILGLRQQCWSTSCWDRPHPASHLGWTSHTEDRHNLHQPFIHRAAKDSHLAGSKIITARMTAGQFDLGCLKRDTSNPAQRSQIGARMGWYPENCWASCRTRWGCTTALPGHELRAWAGDRDRDRDRQEPALLLHILTPCSPLKLPGKVKSCRELSILSLPHSPQAQDGSRGSVTWHRAELCCALCAPQSMCWGWRAARPLWLPPALQTQGYQ